MQILSYFDLKYDFLFIIINILLLGVLFGFWQYLELLLYAIPEETSSSEIQKKIIATMFNPRDSRADRVAIWAAAGACLLTALGYI